MEEFLTDHGFTQSDEDPDVLEAYFTEEDSAYLVSYLGIADEYNTLVVQYNTATEEAIVTVDGESYDVGEDELMAALEGDI